MVLEEVGYYGKGYFAKHKFEIIPLISIQKGLAFKFFFLKAKFTKEHL